MRGFMRLAFSLFVIVVLFDVKAVRAEAAVTLRVAEVLDPRPGIAWPVAQWSWAGYQQTTAVKCMRVQFSNQPHGDGGKPAGLSVAAISLAGPYLGGAAVNVDSTWPSDRTLAASGQVVFNNATGYVPGGSAYFGVSYLAQASAEQAVWMTVTTYDQVGTGSSGNCAGNVLDGPETAAFHTLQTTQVAGVVDPTFSFGVDSHSGSCNGVGQNATAGSTSVSLGSLDSSSVRRAAQSLTVSSSAGNGFNVYLSSTAAAPGQVFGDGRGNFIADSSGTTASPAAMSGGTAAFGYTRPALGAGGDVYARVPASGSADVVLSGSSGSVGTTGCVLYAAAASAATPAGSYSATIVYRAVPSF